MLIMKIMIVGELMMRMVIKMKVEGKKIVEVNFYLHFILILNPY